MSRAEHSDRLTAADLANIVFRARAASGIADQDRAYLTDLCTEIGLLTAERDDARDELDIASKLAAERDEFARALAVGPCARSSDNGGYRCGTTDDGSPDFGASLCPTCKARAALEVTRDV